MLTDLLAFLDLLARDHRPAAVAAAAPAARTGRGSSEPAAAFHHSRYGYDRALYGRQMGARQSYNPKNKGKKSYQPILTFIAETRAYIGGSCATETDPRGYRSRALCRPSA